MRICIASVQTVLTGLTQPYGNSTSAIHKTPRLEPIAVDWLGLEGDEQADSRIHGDPHKAVHIYPYEHYDYWRTILGNLSLLQNPGAFGENISSLGISESMLCIGDQLSIGTSLLEISQTRQPCHKLNSRFHRVDMAQRMQSSLRTGFYCRVLRPGKLQAGDSIILCARPHPEWSLLRLMQIFYHQPLQRDLLQQMRSLPLSPSWQKYLQQRLSSGQLEDWTERMQGKPTTK